MARSLRGPCFFAFWGAWGRGMRIATASVRTGFAMTGSYTWGAVQGWAGGVEPRPYGWVTRSAVGWDDVGSELSAASGRSSEVSEWPRSKFPASAVRQRRNFGHRNRVIVPYGCIQGVRGKWRIYRGLPGEGQREGNFWLNWGEGREFF